MQKTQVTSILEGRRRRRRRKEFLGCSGALSAANDPTRSSPCSSSLSLSSSHSVSVAPGEGEGRNIHHSFINSSIPSPSSPASAICCCPSINEQKKKIFPRTCQGQKRGFSSQKQVELQLCLSERFITLKKV